MQYMGGKENIARPVSELLRYLGEGCDRYLEPFMGGASIASRMAPCFSLSTVSDGDLAVASFWFAISQGWVPPSRVTREEYRAAKALKDTDPMKGFIKYGCSYGGKPWGGYTDRVIGSGSADTASRVSIRKGAGLASADIRWADYREYSPGTGTLVYCDPPYAGTTGYRTTWDSGEFWSTMDSWVDAGAIVCVSEYQAPSNWTSAWSRTKGMKLTASSNSTVAVERVFVR